jgi:hypothetical protein
MNERRPKSSLACVTVMRAILARPSKSWMNWEYVHRRLQPITGMK